MKNPTPSKVVLNTSAIIALLSMLFCIILVFVFKMASPWLLLIIPVLVFVVALFSIRYAIENFIYRKIKLIYKSIHEKKKSESITQKPPLGEHIIESVEKEVSDWADKKEAEIAGLKAMEQFRREFVGNVSHELKTPIFNIEGYLDTLIHGGLEDGKINKDYLLRALKNVNRLNLIVNDLEDISMLESGSVSLNMKPFDIHALTAELMDSLAMMADNYHVKLSFKRGSKGPVMVIGDQDKIRQVLTNLIINSIKYGVDNGRTRIGFYDLDKHILTEISDNGIGISDKHIPRLFERFYRVDKGRSRSEGGTGLGLSIVKHIIEAHGETINVRSTPKIGSTFGFTLQKA